MKGWGGKCNPWIHPCPLICPNMPGTVLSHHVQRPWVPCTHNQAMFLCFSAGLRELLCISPADGLVSGRQFPGKTLRRMQACRFLPRVLTQIQMENILFTFPAATWSQPSRAPGPWRSPALRERTQRKTSSVYMGTAGKGKG